MRRVSAEDLAAAREAWARVGVRVAARGRMRVSRTGGGYSRRGERDVTPELPMQPAAVLLYDERGRAPVFVVDLDTGKAGHDAVETEVAAIEALMDAAGLHARFGDASVSGGRHLYVPLATPVPFGEAREAAVALEVLFASVDAMPMRGLEGGCIRPPGAWHRRGGHQVLTGTLEAAEAALNAPNNELAWRRFLDTLRARVPHAADIAARHSDYTGENGHPRPLDPPHHSHGTDAGQVVELEQLTPLAGWNEPDGRYQHIARTGEYDPRRYQSASEARQGVLWACAASGWAFGDVVRRLEDGTWPGLASFYAKYRARHTAVAADWRAAVEHEKRRRGNQGDSAVRKCTTSGHKTRRGEEKPPAPAPGRLTSRGVQQFVREWLAAVDLLHGPETDLAMRALLYTLAEMAVLTERIEVQVGNRSLAIGSASDHGTVSRVLRRLLAEPADRALVDVIQEAHGVQAHVIQLRIPALLAAHCAAKPWRRGRVHGIRAAFRDLGRAAAFVYDALERVDGPIGGRELAAAARISVSATYDALAVLSAWGLATNTGAGWIVGDASLARLAEQFGTDEAVRAQIERYRNDRRAWWAWLVAKGLLDPAWVERRTTPPPQPEPPPCTAWAEDTSVVELLVRELGAQVIDLAG